MKTGIISILLLIFFCKSNAQSKHMVVNLPKKNQLTDTVFKAVTFTSLLDSSLNIKAPSVAIPNAFDKPSLRQKNFILLKKLSGKESVIMPGTENLDKFDRQRDTIKRNNFPKE